MSKTLKRRYEPAHIFPQPVLLHGEKAERNGFDDNGAREPFLFEHEGKFYLHYDGNGDDSWSCCLAVSDDLIHWDKKGRKLHKGEQGELDGAGACYGPTYYFEGKWFLFYVSIQETSGAPWYVPALPYRTGLAVAEQPEGPWTKVSNNVFPLGEEGSWNDGCICAPYIVKQEDGYYAFYSGSNLGPPYHRTIGMATSSSPSGPWIHRNAPILPVDEQLENPSLYYEASSELWFMFVNHIHRDEQGAEYTDAVWVYWSKSLTEWNASDKAVVLDAKNIPWVPQIVGLPSCMVVDRKLWIAFDASDKGIDENLMGHMRRNIGMCYFDLPLQLPKKQGVK